MVPQVQFNATDEFSQRFSIRKALFIEEKKQTDSTETFHVTKLITVL